MNKNVILVVGAGVVLIGIGAWLFFSDETQGPLAVTDSSSSLPMQGEEFAIAGREHIKPGESHAPYNSNPPTSGPHYVEPADWGVYQLALPDEQLVHNLEHGGIWISYKGIDAQTKEKIEAVGRSNPGSVVVTPREANDSPIAVASWGRLMKLAAYDETKILDFIKANKNKSPEPLAR